MIVFTFLMFFVVRSVNSETMSDLIWENGIYLIQFSSQNGMKEVKKIIIQH